MPVYLPTSILGNSRNLVTLGGSGEIMAWFYPHKDAFQHITACLPCVYFGDGGRGQLHFSFEAVFERAQSYLGDSNVLTTTLHNNGLTMEFEDVMPDNFPLLARRIRVFNGGAARWNGGVYHLGDWKMGGHREGNGVRFDGSGQMVIQNHREFALALGGDALESHHLGKAGANWNSNARYALERGVLASNQLEIGDVNFAAGFYLDLAPGESAQRTLFFALGQSESEARNVLGVGQARGFEWFRDERIRLDGEFLQRGLSTLKGAAFPGRRAPGAEKAEAEDVGAEEAGVEEAEAEKVGAEEAEAEEVGVEKAEAEKAGVEKATVEDVRAEEATVEEAGVEDAVHGVSPVLFEAFKRSLLALPLLQGEEGAAVAAPEFDPEFISCGGYGYHWPRDGGEYVAGLLDAGYPEFARGFFEWCARHQDVRGLWHQRYHLNGEVGPNWCLPPDTLQIDEVGAIGWAFGKVQNALPTFEVTDEAKRMLDLSSDYLLSRLDERTGVHQNAFDTWETFIGSFTYSNAAIYAHLQSAARVCDQPKFALAAARLKSGVLTHFVRQTSGVRHLVRGFKGDGSPDETIDSANLGAIEPFGLLDLRVDDELEIALGTLDIITERLEVEWQGGRAIRRFEGDEYVGGVPACVNTLWMARCCLHVAGELKTRHRTDEAAILIERADGFLKVVLKRATPTGLLPELMQGPEGQTFWAAPHGWAMASFVSGVLKLARLKAAL